MASGPGSLLVEVAERGDADAVVTAARDTVRAWIGAGPVFLATADPLTGEFTSLYTFDIPDDAAAAFFAIESTGADVTSFGRLSRLPTPSASLYAATGGRPTSSRRWREVMSPLGWGDELRAAVRVDGSVWGYLCMHREADERSFAAREVDRLATLLPAIGAALRAAGRGSATRDAGLGTGVVLVDHRCRVDGLTGAAEAWLDEIGPRDRDGLPLILAELARQVLATGLPATRRIITRTRRLGVVDAAELQRTREAVIAISIGPAQIEDRLGHFAVASGLTPREQEVVLCVVGGLSTRAIAERLAISPRTVQAHLTSIFTKTALRSRGELVGRLLR